MSDTYALGPGEVDISEQALFVVVPTIRPGVLGDFCEEWSVEEDDGVTYVFVHDAPEVPEISGVPKGKCVHHICWKTAEDLMGDQAWIIPRRTDAVRNLGFLWAKRLGAKHILSLDDDCSPIDRSSRFYERHLNPLIRGVLPSFCTTHDRKKFVPRGLPGTLAGERMRPRRVVINHGLWWGVPDLAAETQQALMADEVSIDWRGASGNLEVVPPGFFYPMCGMNVSFHVDVLPAMYFPLQGMMKRGDSLIPIGFDRWADIWCGHISKTVADACGFYVTSGGPIVSHERMSDPSSNLDKERGGYGVSRMLLDRLLVQSRDLMLEEAEAADVPDLVDCIGQSISFPDHGRGKIRGYSKGRYLNFLRDALKVWVEWTKD